MVKKNIIEKKRLKRGLKKIKHLYKIYPWLNNSKKKTNLNTKIFFEGMNFISKSLEYEIYRRIEKLRFVFWENKSIFSVFNLKRRLGKNEFIFFEIYNFLMNLFNWESGISSNCNSNVFLQSFDRSFIGEKILFKNYKIIHSEKVRDYFKKNMLIYSLGYK